MPCCMKVFRIGSALFTLNHHNDDDSRTLEDANGTTHLSFDSSLNIYDANGKIGDLENIGDKWVFLKNPLRSLIDTGVKVNDYHWDDLMEAEVFVCRHHIESLTKNAAPVA